MEYVDPDPSPVISFTLLKVFGKKIVEMAQKDETIVAVTPAMSAGSCLDALMKEFPKRCYDVGIAEGHAVTFAGGLAKGGKSKVFIPKYQGGGWTNTTSD